MRTLRPSLKLWDYFVNWDKVFKNTRALEIDLNLWNVLLGKENFEEETLKLLEEHPQIVRAIPTLIVRDGAGSARFEMYEDLSSLTNPPEIFDFDSPADSDAKRKAVIKFINNTGLRRIFEKDGVKNLVDYVMGVEAGLDSNGRKNRSGTNMEGIVETYLSGLADLSQIKYISQANQNTILREFGKKVPIDKSNRIYDFAIERNGQLIVMEVNFYSGGGSKLKATAEEYMRLNSLLKNSGVSFIWITDGQGWHTTRAKLKEAFMELDNVWNLQWLGEGFLSA